MRSTDPTGTRNVITAAATAEVERDEPAICGTVTLHCVDQGEPLRLVMPMLDAMVLLNSLREIEAIFGLEEWTGRLGCSLNAIDRFAAELRQQHDQTDAEGADESPPSTNLLIN